MARLVLLVPGSGSVPPGRWGFGLRSTLATPLPQTPEEVDLEVASRYQDYVLEVLSTDGKLIATRRFDRVQDVARGVAAGFWVRTEDDALQTLTIVEPVLVRR